MEIMLFVVDLSGTNGMSGSRNEPRCLAMTFAVHLRNITLIVLAPICLDLVDITNLSLNQCIFSTMFHSSPKLYLLTGIFFQNCSKLETLLFLSASNVFRGGSLSPKTNPLATPLYIWYVLFEP